MNKEQNEKVLNKLISTGADFAEIFEEKSHLKTYRYLDGKLDSINNNIVKGIGLRIAKNKEVYYGYTNDFENVDTTIDKLIVNIEEQPMLDKVSLQELEVYEKDTSIKSMSSKDIKMYLKSIDEKVRQKNDKISQVAITLLSNSKEITISNHTGLYKKEFRNGTRLFVSVILKENSNIAEAGFNYGNSGGVELFETFDLDKEIDMMLESAENKLKAVDTKGGMMPVIIAPGFGAVIFHEACGHAMEAWLVADDLSVLKDKINCKIASDKVNIVDDGTMSNLWGTTRIDDEGNPTQRNYLIKDGVLQSYLVDELNGRKMNLKSTGSGRRENYKFAPVSRMNNTYLLPGTDKIEDMIKSIDYGLYATKMGGGSVTTTTGDFNFSVKEGFIIENGEIKEPIKSASLIGNTLEILNNVEMVSDDLKIDSGNCGAASGWVPVTCGEPTIKVSSIMVGGIND